MVTEVQRMPSPILARWKAACRRKWSLCGPRCEGKLAAVVSLVSLKGRLPDENNGAAASGCAAVDKEVPEEAL